ncbi:ABC transporter permease/substrate-binding protein [Sphingomonas sp.]|uniref:ABC transporter permease/substrate-binding protein n=1 Tax=Sphingomonas sp. TaxID=28214 RepID=UPI003AFF8FA2
MSDVLAQVPGLAAHHLLLAAAALALALAIALPLGLAAASRPRLAAIGVGVAGTIQTIPGLALLALFYPLLLAVGHGVPALGFLPAFGALTLYALLPILRNVIAGLRGLDPAVVRAADGIGMTRAQRLRLVEAPLAAPVVMAGIRTAAVWTIGAATLATTVGAPSLGNLIFSGLQTEDWPQVVAGCLASAALAIVADAALALVEHGLARRRRVPLWSGIAIVAAGLALAGAALARPARPTIVIGAKNFSEQFILARVIGDRLTAAGYAVSFREGLGSGVALHALRGGDVDVYVDYSGTIWADAMHRSDAAPRETMLAGIRRFLAPSGATVLGPLGFENAYALAMRRDRARGLGVGDLADLARVAPRLTLGADLEFLSRPEWRAVTSAYGLAFAATRAYAPSFMYRALGGGQADVISAFSSDGRIAADDLVVLGDPRHALPGYDAILLVDGAHARDPRLVAALRPLIGAIPVAAMRVANYMVDRDAGKRRPAEAARWLEARAGRP